MSHVTIMNTSWSSWEKSPGNRRRENMDRKVRPIVVLSNVDEQCLTFFWKDNPNFYVGYRFIEHTPEAIAATLSHVDWLKRNVTNGEPRFGNRIPLFGECDPWRKNWMTHYTEQDVNDSVQLSFTSFSDGSACCSCQDCGGVQRREVFFSPDETGVALRMTLTTSVLIPGAFCVQQCLRFTGQTNKPWRKQVAYIPFLSEFDLQSQSSPLETLTYARQNGGWVNFGRDHSAYHTPCGLPVLGTRSRGQIDHGLIVRESHDRKYSSGMYWERTAYVSNGHPADCVHASVDLGPLKAGETRGVSGKFYFLEGSKDELLKLWEKDYGV